MPGINLGGELGLTPYNKSVAAFARYARSSEHGAERRAGNA